MARVSFASVRYYLGVSIIQMGTLLFILIISGIYRPFYSPGVVYVPVINPRPKPDVPIVLSGKPLRLEIPAIILNRELLDGIYTPEDGSWTLTPRGIHYAIGSALANNQSGSTFIYGHNNRHVFGPLPKLNVGEEAIVTTDNNLVFTYRYTARETLKPDNTSPLSYTGSPRLTLQTCSGNWYQNRELFYFELTKVSDLTKKEDYDYKRSV
jgi:LPXTG-site transpeptidase (sortase) family protein